ncbi:dihydrofolate reductase family protein [Desertivirga brevis]|uniref:dihydrofolate reductase family protein n=1 Tax=Desertivirga brevis TaxID=2810310 RepID=UPI001A979DD5|nr:dihydrofolate reductase family protein [Pedobacter sp. SYSU D00873]
MRKIFLSVMVSLDGFIEGPNKNIDWHVWDNDMDNYMSDFFKGIDRIILGRIAYEMMADYWPTSAAESENPLIAHKMNKLNKLVFTKSLESAKWRNSQIVRELVKEEVLKIKDQGEKDIVIFGGGSIIQEFIHHDLIDEYRLIVNPVVLGSGKRLFAEGSEQRNLKLLQAIPKASGNVVLCYSRFN